MLYTICKSIRNFFPIVASKEDAFVIESGAISLPFVAEDQYILIEGSAFNDGIYKYPVSDLVDETFNGCISVRAIPQEFVDLATEIEAYKTNHKLDGLSSESFGGYSYSRATNANGCLQDWQDVYRERLNAWRKI